MTMSNDQVYYFDNNATTRMDDETVEAMRPFLTYEFANPAGAYGPARRAALAVAQARNRVARLLGARDDEIVFTSGGTESNATAIANALRARPTRRRLVASAVEHASVYEPLRQLEQRCYDVRWIPVSPEGALDLAALEQAVDEDTALVAIMAANNETGALFPLQRAAQEARRRGALFHTDAVQMAGKLPFNVCDSGADSAAFCAHKLHGPKGVGALYVRAGTDFEGLLKGGDQEGGRRAGTEHVAGLVGFGQAAERAAARLVDTASALHQMRDDFERALAAAVPDVSFVADAVPRLPNTSLVRLVGADTEALLALLDMAGLCCSSGSACASGAHEPSRVLQAMGLADRRAVATLRISLSRFNTAKEVDYLVHRVQASVMALRAQLQPGDRARPTQHGS